MQDKLQFNNYKNTNISKVVLISGGSRGIGEATVRAFCAEGYKTAFLYNNNTEKAKLLENELGKNCLALKCDVSNKTDCENAVAAVAKQFGTVDILIHNAGIAQQKLFTDITQTDWSQMLNVHLTGAFYLCQCAAPDMIRKKSGKILTISSMWGQVGASCEVHYSAAKAGLIGFTKAIAKELAPSGITANCICPGAIQTDMLKDFSAEDKAMLCEEIPLARIGTATEVADFLVFLSSDKASYFTGQVFGLNGGMVI